MLIDSQFLNSVLQLNIENIRTVYPQIYNWINSNSRKVGMHHTKFQRELSKTLSVHQCAVDLSDRFTRVVRC